MAVIENDFTRDEVPGKISTKFRKFRILRLYYFAAAFYALPFFSLFLFIVDQFTISKTEMLFWLIFLVSLAPCGLTGIILCTCGLVKSYKINSKLNKIIGSIGLLLGIGGVVAGVLGLMLIYVVVN